MAKSISVSIGTMDLRSSVGFNGQIQFERAITPYASTEEAHPVVSQKKTKKVQREAKRKAKKFSIHSETTDPTAMEGAGKETEQKHYAPTICTPVTASSADVDGEPVYHDSVSFMTESIRGVEVNVDIVASAQITESSIPRTSHGRHDQWLRFSRVFKVDQLTIPSLWPSEKCAHSSTCNFDNLGILDCPFHEPRKLFSLSTSSRTDLISQTVTV